MSAGEELKDVFRELDQSTDRALIGLSRIRKGAKIDRLRPSPVLIIAQTGLVLSLFVLINIWSSVSGIQ